MIDLLPTEEQQALTDAVAAFLSQELPVKRVRELTASGHGVSVSTWRRCAAQGWFGLGLPQEVGGTGYGLAEQALMFRELGRQLTPGPILGTVAAAHLAAAAGGQDELLAGLLDGRLRANLGYSPTGLDKVLVWHAGEAGLLVVIDSVTGTAELFDLRGIAVSEAGPSIDPAYRIGVMPRARLPEPLYRAQTWPIVLSMTGLLAAMLCGIAEAERDMNAEYVTRRVQFGHPIGSFQAVKHRAADSAVRAESAWCQTILALLRCGAGTADAGIQISAAKVVAAEAAVLNGRDNIQNHGAIGFTAQHDAHLFLKRAQVYAAMLGEPKDHLRRLFNSPAPQ